eukprot:sb/3464924/
MVGYSAQGGNILERYPSGKIVLVPLITNDDDLDTVSLAGFAQAYLGIPCEVHPPITATVENGKVFIPPTGKSKRRRNLKSRISSENGKFQIQVSSALSLAKSLLTSDTIALIVLTKLELFDTDPDLFVAGMAEGNSRVAVFSLLRYDPNLTFSPEHWWDVREKKGRGRVKEGDRKRLVMERSCKLAPRGGLQATHASVSCVSEEGVRAGGMVCGGEILEKFGRVIKVSIPRDEKHRSKGIAFALFLEREPCIRLINAFDGTQLFGRTLHCSIAKDNGRTREFIRRKEYPEKNSCYECGEMGHLSYKCTQNVLGERKRPRRKKRKRKDPREEPDNYNDPDISLAQAVDEDAAEREEEERRVAETMPPPPSAPVVLVAVYQGPDGQLIGSASNEGWVSMSDHTPGRKKEGKRKRFTQDSYFSDEEILEES